MTRYIDADALNKALNDRVDAINENRRKGATLPNIAWFSGMACAESIVEAQPTVDAIPIEFIKARMEGYYKNSYTELGACLETLIEDWRKEHDTADKCGCSVQNP